MTATTTTLPAVRDVLETYRTCELVTVGRTGVPVAWPAVCAVAPAGDVVTLTTSVALPVKALNVRRDPRVALLFSDPTGTGRDDLPQVLLRGTATCPEEIHTSPAGLEDYWLKLWQRQPDVVPTSPRIARAVMDFYYLRLVLTVTPQEVTTSAPLRRAGGLPESGRESRPDDAAHRLAAHPDAVLTVAEAAAPPRPVRVRVAPGTCAGGLVLTRVDGAPLDHVPPSTTAANLMAHSHDAMPAAMSAARPAPGPPGAEGILHGSRPARRPGQSCMRTARIDVPDRDVLGLDRATARAAGSRRPRHARTGSRRAESTNRLWDCRPCRPCRPGLGRRHANRRPRARAAGRRAENGRGRRAARRRARREVRDGRARFRHWARG